MWIYLYIVVKLTSQLGNFCTEQWKLILLKTVNYIVRYLLLFGSFPEHSNDQKGNVLNTVRCNFTFKCNLKYFIENLNFNQ